MEKKDLIALAIAVSMYLSGVALGVAVGRVNARAEFQRNAVASGCGEYYNDNGVTSFRFKGEK